MYILHTVYRTSVFATVGGTRKKKRRIRLHLLAKPRSKKQNAAFEEFEEYVQGFTAGFNDWVEDFYGLL